MRVTRSSIGAPSSTSSSAASAAVASVAAAARSSRRTSVPRSTLPIGSAPASSAPRTPGATRSSASTELARSTGSSSTSSTARRHSTGPPGSSSSSRASAGGRRRCSRPCGPRPAPRRRLEQRGEAAVGADEHPQGQGQCRHPVQMTSAARSLFHGDLVAECERRDERDPVAAPEPPRVVPARPAGGSEAGPCAGRWSPPVPRSRRTPATTRGGARARSATGARGPGVVGNGRPSKRAITSISRSS